MRERLIETINQNIEEFSTNTNDFIDVSEKYDKTKKNFVYVKSVESLIHIKSISFGNKSIDSRIYINSGLSGSLSIKVEQKNSVVFIGKDCSLRSTSIICQALGSVVAVGNGVSTSGTNRWLSGAFPCSEFASIVVGDNCMFSSDITLRGSDGHPIMNNDFTNQLNVPKDYLVIEPYVWIGQDVKILKSVRIGACSIIGISSVVTKSIPRFSKAYGVPAKYRPLSGVWVRDRSVKSLDTAKKYISLYRER